jgi:predicted alpha/beta superfamily hydrolase
MLKISLFIVTFFVLTLTSTIAQTNSNENKIGTSHSIKSDILEQNRPYWVHLPQDYNPEEKKYSVMYLLDGEIHFNYTAGYLDILPFDGKIKQTILVAIPNTHRLRDLTPTHSDNGLDGKAIELFAQSGGGEKFLNFIKEELVPQIEKDYSTNGHRILAGHSNSGLFSIFAFLAAPDFFQSFIAIDPTLIWDNEVLIKRLVARINTPPSSKNFLYISSANNENDPFLPAKKMKNAQMKFVNILSKWKSDKFKIEYEHFENENHLTSAFVGMLHGLQFVFSEEN